MGFQSRFIEMFSNINETAKLKELSEVSGGLTKNQQRSKMSLQLPYLRVANVYFGKIDTTEILNIGLTEDEYKRTLLKTGDLLFVEGNGSPEQIGRVAVWNAEINRCVHQNHLIKARFKAKKINSVYALYYFMSQKGRNQIKTKAVSTSGLYTLSISKIEDLELPVPPIELQNQFAYFVAQVDKSKLALQESLDKLEKLQKALIKKYLG